VYPEQSKPDGDVPPKTYGVPINRMALRVRLIAIDDVRLMIPRAKRCIVSECFIASVICGVSVIPVALLFDVHIARSAVALGITDIVSIARSSARAWIETLKGSARFEVASSPRRSIPTCEAVATIGADT